MFWYRLNTSITSITSERIWSKNFQKWALFVPELDFWRGVVLGTRLSGNDCTKQPIMTPQHETYIWCFSSHFAKSCWGLERGQDWKSHSAIISSWIHFQPGHSAHFLKLLLEFHRILETVSIYQHFEQIMLVIQVNRPRDWRRSNCVNPMMLS